MNTHSGPCRLCGRIGCASIQMTQPGRPIDAIGTHWRLVCLDRQVDSLRKQVEAMQSATVQPATVDAQADAAELEQWRRALVWRRFDNYGWSLQVAKIGFGDAHVSSDGDGLWFVGRCRSEFYRNRDAAMRAVEAAFGLPKCRVEGECT